MAGILRGDAVWADLKPVVGMSNPDEDLLWYSAEMFLTTCPAVLLR